MGKKEIYFFWVLLSYFTSVDKNKYQIQIALRPKIDPTVTLMQVEEKPDVTYEQVGGMTEELDQLREVFVNEISSLVHPNSFELGA